MANLLANSNSVLLIKVLEGSNLYFQVQSEIFSSNFAIETPQPFRRPFFCFSCNPSHAVIGEAPLRNTIFIKF